MAKATASAAPTPRLKALYLDQYRKELQAELALSNVHQVPKLEKIVVSAGIGKHKEDKRYHQLVRNTITKITGQAPVDRLAKKSIAGFKIRAGTTLALLTRVFSPSSPLRRRRSFMASR